MAGSHEELGLLIAQFPSLALLGVLQSLATISLIYVSQWPDFFVRQLHARSTGLSFCLPIQAIHSDRFTFLNPNSKRQGDSD